MSDGKEIERIDSEAADLLTDATSSRYAKYGRFILTMMSSVPWVGGMIGAVSALHAEEEQGRVNDFLRAWVSEHEQKMKRLTGTIQEIIDRVEQLGDAAKERLTSEEFQDVAGQAFRVFDKAATEDKREFVRRLLTNAAATPAVEDDTLRLFIAWIDHYSESHFKVIKAVYAKRGITRLGIWKAIGGRIPTPRENSSQADLFRMLIHDLSTGRVIRQHRLVDGNGNFLKKSATREQPRRPASQFTVSSFEDEEPYELSELGSEFVHYVLTDAVRRIAESPTAKNPVDPTQG